MALAKSFWSGYWKSVPIVAATRFYSVTTQMPEMSKSFLAMPGNSEQVAEFLKTNFKSNSKSPEYIYEKMPEEILIQVPDSSGSIAGTVRARLAGSFEYMPITLIDCFCVRPDMRRKGLGTFLLGSIKQACANNNIYNAIFLKEGSPINVPGILPVYSSYYAYRHIAELEKSTQVSYMTPSQAYSLISTYSMLRPDTFMILNKRSENQKWLIYRSPSVSSSMPYNSGIWVLALIQNSYQTISGKKIAWVTGWIESPLVNEETRTLASETISSSIARLGYDWVWLDYKWIGKSTKFQQDGSFHWYTYQWSTSLIPDMSYIIMA